MHYSNHSVDAAERNNNIARHHIASIHMYTTGKPSIGEHYTSAKTWSSMLAFLPLWLAKFMVATVCKPKYLISCNGTFLQPLSLFA